MVSFQMVSTLSTGLQTGQTTSDSHPFISKGKRNITVQVDIEIKILHKGSILSKIYFTNGFQQYVSLAVCECVLKHTVLKSVLF